MRLFAAIVALVAFGSGCLAYNEQCTALVANPNQVVATLGEEVFLDRNNARHDNNAIGQVAADAFVDVFAATSTPVDFGILNGGSLRAEGICGVTRNIVRGELTDQVLHEILLFENIVNAVDLTEPEVLAVFEHSVDALFPSTSPIVSPPGYFLQVSGNVKLTVDCTRAVGSRVTALTINGQAITKPGRTDVKRRVALSTFLLGGGDGYSMLVQPGVDPSRNPAPAQKFGGIDSNIAADFMRRTYQQPGVQVKKDASRITFIGCAVPTRPAN